MKIVTVTIVKNESDIIESFIRYHLNIVDEMIILDNKSTDETSIIINKLINEGKPITLIDDSDIFYNQNIKMTNLIHIAIEKHDADIICPLDVDEFITSKDGNNPREILEKIDLNYYYLIKWITYIPTSYDDYTIKFIPSRINHIRDENVETFKKVIVPKEIVNKYSVQLKMGNHDLIFCNNDAKKFVNKNLPLNIAHFPIRSKEQCMSKILNGWPNMIAINLNNEAWGFHWERIFNRIKNGRKITYSDLETFSKNYSIYNEPQEEIKIKKSPMPLDFCENIEIKYHYEYDYLSNILENYVYFAKEIASLKRELNNKKTLKR